MKALKLLQQEGEGRERDEASQCGMAVKALKLLGLVRFHRGLRGASESQCGMAVKALKLVKTLDVRPSDIPARVAMRNGREGIETPPTLVALDPITVPKKSQCGMAVKALKPLPADGTTGAGVAMRNGREGIETFLSGHGFSVVGSRNAEWP